MRTSPRSSGGGFTIIELMIAVAIVSILASVAIPAFTRYIRKSYTVEVYESLDKIATGARVYFENKGAFPDSTGMTPSMTHEQACSSGHHMFPISTLPEFDSKEWVSLMFRPTQSFRYRYQWQNNSDPTASPPIYHGVISAAGDLDCDGVLSLFQIHLQKLGSGPLMRLGTFVIGDETE